jgi:hypothetical protein
MRLACTKRPPSADHRDSNAGAHTRPADPGEGRSANAHEKTQAAARERITRILPAGVID